MIEIKKESVLIKPKDIKSSSSDYEVLGALNPAVARLSSGDIILYVRVIEKLILDSDDKYQYSPRMIGKEKFEVSKDRYPNKKVESSTDLDFSFNDDTKRLKFISHFRRVVLDPSGFRVKFIDDKPSFFGLKWDGELGVEDPRITKIEDSYYMTYVSLSKSGNISTSLAVSNDCVNWYRRGVIFGHQNKDVVLFPERIRKHYLAINRPEGNFEFSSPHMWISKSDNLEYWGSNKSLELSEDGSWDSGRVGSGPPPLKTDKGWLLIYHGVLSEKMRESKSFLARIEKIFGRGKIEEERSVYCAGVALLHLENPEKIIVKSKRPMLFPRKSYERGTFEKKDVIFPTGMIWDLNKKDILVFSGAGDICTSVKKISYEKIIEFMK